MNQSIPNDLQGHLSDGFTVYRMSLAIAQHFNPDNRYHYNSLRTKNSPNYSLVKCSRNSYERRKNVIYFTKLSKMFNGNLRKIEDFIVANILKDPRWGTGNLTDDESVSTYKEYLFETDNKHLRNRCITEYRRVKPKADRSNNVAGRTSIVADSETVINDVADCSPNTLELNSVYFKLCVLSKTGTHPIIVRELLGSRISVETLTIFMALSGCHTDWDQTDPSIAAAIPRLIAYESLLEWDVHKCMDIMRTIWHPSC